MHLAACSALACVYLVGIVMGSLPVQNSTTSTMRQRRRASVASCFAFPPSPIPFPSVKEARPFTPPPLFDQTKRSLLCTSLQLYVPPALRQDVPLAPACNSAVPAPPCTSLQLYVPPALRLDETEFTAFLQARALLCRTLCHAYPASTARKLQASRALCTLR